MISLPQPTLAMALKRLFFALDPNSKLEALTHIKVDAYDDIVKFSASSRKISAEALVKSGAARTDRLTFGTAGALLRNIVMAFPADAYITLAIDKTSLLVKTPSSTFKLPVLDPSVIPTLVDYSKLSFDMIDMSQLLQGISSTLFCSNKDGNQDYNKGVYLNKHHFVATDSFRLVCFPNKSIPTKGHAALLPTDSAASLLKMFPGTKEGGILVTNEAVHVYGDGLYATMRTLGCDFPNYQAIIPTGKCVSYEFVKKDLVVPLERLGLLSGIAPFVKFTFSSQAKMLYLTAKSETGEGYEAMQCDPVVDQELTLNLKQLLDAVEHIDEDKVTMEFHASPNDGMVVVRSGDYVHVLSTIN